MYRKTVCSTSGEYSSPFLLRLALCFMGVLLVLLALGTLVSGIYVAFFLVVSLNKWIPILGVAISSGLLILEGFDRKPLLSFFIAFGILLVNFTYNVFFEVFI